MNALRELLAKFTVEVDPEGNLPKGNRQVDALRDKLAGVDRAALGIGDRLRTAFAGLPGSVRAATAGIPAAAAGRVGAFADAIGVRLRGAFDGVRSSLNEPRLGFLSGLANMNNLLAATGIGFATRAMWGFVDSTITAAAAVNDMAQRLGVTTDEFQELQGVAQLGGSDVSAVATAFTTLSRSALEFAQTGKGEAGEAFQRLGIQVKDANGEVRPAIELFYEAGDALAGLDNATERQAYAQRLMGRSARELLPVFNDLASMTAAQRAEVRALSVVYGEDFVQAAAEADDKMLIAGKVLESLKAKFVSALLPAIVGGVEALQSFAKWLGEATKGLSLGRIAFVGAALAISPYIRVLGALVTLGGGWTKVMAGMARGAAGLVRSFAPVVAAFLVLEDLLVFFAGGKSATGRLLDNVFGKGVGAEVQKTIVDLTVAFKDLWKWILGDGAGEKAKSLFAEISEGVRLLVNDALAQIPGSGRTAGLEGLRAYERSERSRVIQTRDTRGTPDPFLSGAFGGPNLLAPPTRQGTTVIDNSTKTVQVNMPQGSSPMQTADAVSKRLESDRAGIAARVP